MGEASHGGKPRDLNTSIIYLGAWCTAFIVSASRASEFMLGFTNTTQDIKLR